MASNMANSDVECPVCHDDLNEPKLLPCTHIVCEMRTSTAVSQSQPNTPAASRGTAVSYSQLNTPAASQSQPNTPAAASQSQPNTPAASRGQVKPRRAELARVIKVGDRVKRGPDWQPYIGDQDGGGPGTVTQVRGDGVVFVRWDNNGRLGVYRMGYNDCYELDLL